MPDEPFDKPAHSEEQCREADRTYQAPLRVKARLHNKQTDEIKEMTVYMGDFPLMTSQGTFIYNGAERVVVSQLVRSPGVYFSAEDDPATGRRRFGAKLIPKRGAWLEFETANQNLIGVKIDRKRRLPVTTFLRAISKEWGSDDVLLDLFADIDTDRTISSFDRRSVTPARGATPPSATKTASSSSTTVCDPATRRPSTTPAP